MLVERHPVRSLRTRPPAYRERTRHQTGGANRGFTLTELTIVLVIVALLLGGMLLPLSAQQDIRARREASRQLDEISEALLGFAVVNGYLPCPAISSSDGKEDRAAATGKCTDDKRRGLLPWVTLGVKGDDAWGRQFQYSVTPAFANSVTLFALSTPRDITIKTRDDSGNTVNLSNQDDIPVVILSTGKNGYWSWTFDSATQNSDSANDNTDEDSNAASDATGKVFISRTPSGTTSGMGEFDDLLTWISPNVLFNRMIAAGKLP